MFKDNQLDPKNNKIVDELTIHSKTKMQACHLNIKKQKVWVKYLRS